MLSISKLRVLAILAALTLSFQCELLEDDATEVKTGNLKGSASYELPAAEGAGLNFNNVSIKPIRYAVVEVLNDKEQSVITTGATNSKGEFNIDFDFGETAHVRIRIVARIKGNDGGANYKTSDTTTNVLTEVRDNTSGGALWSITSKVYGLSNNTAEEAIHLRATVGNGAAPPFSILDAIFNGYKFIYDSDKSTVFTRARTYWSQNNAATGGNKAAGQIGTSHYGTDHTNSAIRSLYILGLADNDTDQYDIPVIAHEFGHYIEDTLFRSDSIGGSHSLGQHLDVRVAFGEGFGNAFGGIVNNDPVYYDTSGAANGASFSFNLENDGTTNEGIFGEQTVQELIWDVYDSAADAGDTVSLGFSPIFAVMRNQQRTTPALTSIVSFMAYLKQNNAGQAAAIQTLLTNEGIGAVTANDPFSIAGGGATAGVACRTALYAGAVTAFAYNHAGQTLELSNGATNGDGRNKYCATAAYKITGDGGAHNITVDAAANCDTDIYLYKDGSIVAKSEATGEGTDETITGVTLNNAEVYTLDIRTWTVAGSSTAGNCTYSLSIP